MARRGADRRGGGGAARRSGGARPAAPPDARSRRAARRASPRACRPRPARPAARSVFDADTAETMGGRGREGDPRPRSRPAPRTFTACTPRKGILTARGGMTSHAAVVARGMGRPCVSRRRRRSRSTIEPRLMRVGGREIARGRRHHHRRLDRRGDARRGADGPARAGRRFRHADGLGRRASAGCGVRANAETPADCRTAREFGAEGIGLCRTEHMFFDAERIANVRQMILAEDEAGRRARARQAAPRPARRFRRDLPDHGRPAGHHPPARSAAARIPAARRGGVRRGRRGLRASASRRCAAAPPSCTNSTRCSAIAAAGSASPIPKSTRCRRARSSRRRSTVAAEGEAPIPEVMVPLVATRERAGDHPRADRRAPPRRCSPSRAARSTIWSAR